MRVARGFRPGAGSQGPRRRRHGVQTSGPALRQVHRGLGHRGFEGRQGITQGTEWVVEHTSAISGVSHQKTSRPFTRSLIDRTAS